MYSNGPPPATTLYDIFAATAAQFPDNVALEVGNETVSYAQLANTVDRFAAALHEAIDPANTVRVGLYAIPAPETYAGYLAIQRLGYAVIPLNPDAPANRVADTAHAAGLAAVVVPHTEPAQNLDDAGVPTLNLASKAHHAADVQFLQLGQITVDPDTDAYLLFTSGSTGRPKGVPITHRSAIAYVRHAIARCEISANSRLSHTFDLSFDPSVFDLFAAWGTGATIVAPRKRDLLLPARYINERAITHWFSVPSVVTLAMRLGAIPPDSMPGLRWSQFIGEPLTFDQAAAWSRAAPASVIANVYGPT